MSEVNPRVDAFFARPNRWRDEMAALRAIVLDTPLVEEFKWRSPCYTFGKANVAMIWGLKDSCGLSFFKGVLLKDREGILVAPGDNSRSARLVRFTSVAQVAEKEAVLKACIDEAIEVEKAGLKVRFEKDDLAFPEELVARLDEDPDFKAAFEALTPGRRRGYVLHFSQPRQSGTRASRIDRHASRILEGKGMHDR